MQGPQDDLIPWSANDPELDGKYLGQISSDFVKVSDILSEASYQMRERKISEFPIFSISQGNIPLGMLLMGAAERPDLELKYNYRMVMLDELIQRGLIGEDNFDHFKASFKNPDEYCCLLVVEPEFTRFVYIPYPED